MHIFVLGRSGRLEKLILKGISQVDGGVPSKKSYGSGGVGDPKQMQKSVKAGSMAR